MIDIPFSSPTSLPFKLCIRISYISYPFCTWGLAIQGYTGISQDLCMSPHCYIYQCRLLKQKETKMKIASVIGFTFHISYRRFRLDVEGNSCFLFKCELGIFNETCVLLSQRSLQLQGLYKNSLHYFIMTH